MNSILTFTWDAMRVQKWERFMRDLAHSLGVSIQTEVEKGWVWEHGRATIKGPSDKVTLFKDKLDDAMRFANAGFRDGSLRIPCHPLHMGDENPTPERSNKPPAT